jgi:hypothetical protein
VRTHPAAATYHDASKWRLGLLGPGAERLLAPDPPIAPARPVERMAFIDAHRDVAYALADDPRKPATDLVRRLGVSPGYRAPPAERAARRRPGPVMPWPVSARFLVRCLTDKIDVTAKAVSKLREVRAITLTVCPYSLLFSVWVRSISHVQLLESQLAARMPHVQATDCAFVIRPVKLMGQVLDVNGMRIGTVPMNLRRSPLKLPCAFGESPAASGQSSPLHWHVRGTSVHDAAPSTSQTAARR